MEGSLVASTLDENKVFYVVGSSKENSKLGKYSEKGFCWPIQMPSMWFTRGDDGTLTQPLPIHLYLVGLGSLSLKENSQGQTQYHKHFEELEKRLVRQTREEELRRRIGWKNWNEDLVRRNWRGIGRKSWD